MSGSSCFFIFPKASWSGAVIKDVWTRFGKWFTSPGLKSANLLRRCGIIKIGDMVTAIEFVGDDEVLFYKGEIHEQVLIDERVRINRKVTNVFMGVFCGVFAVMYLICRAEEKSRRDVIVVDARGD